MVWVSSPKSCPFDIQPEALEQFDGVIQAVAPAGNQFELIVESFDKAAGLPPLKIVEDPNSVRHTYWVDKMMSRCSSVIG